MKYSIQSLVFPTHPKHQMCLDLFYHGTRSYIDLDQPSYEMGPGAWLDFATYLNGCMYDKWKRFTAVQELVLELELCGDCTVVLVGYREEAAEIVRTEYGRQHVQLEERGKVELAFGADAKASVLGFELYAHGMTRLYDAQYLAVCEESALNHVVLSLATTTCRKEAFIKSNVALIRKELLESDHDIAQNLYVHVTDNGQTLKPEDVEGPHIVLHPNQNSGGSGGYARGMMESLHQDPEVTHVLLMDDDVLILPESIRRTYCLLRLLKPEYQDRWINGAMLNYEDPGVQYEDLGRFMLAGGYMPRKRALEVSDIKEVMENERPYLDYEDMYGAWWYCCIPASAIKQNGLPLPLFIRVDDIEYSIRCHAKFIVMSGICVWHQGFITKYNAAMDEYQVYRNRLIAKSCVPHMNRINVMWNISVNFHQAVLSFNYNGADMIIHAIEDYFRGPEVIMQNNGEAIIKENAQHNEKLLPLSELGIEDEMEIRPEDCYEDEDLKGWDSILRRITYNGHRFCPNRLYRPGRAITSYDSFYYQPQRITLHKELLAVNPYTNMGIIRHLDKKRGIALRKKFKKIEKYYYEHQGELEQKYREAFPTLVSEEFWKQYLGL